MKRTIQETIKYFEYLSHRYAVEAHRNGCEATKAKAEAYEIAAFELKNNMEGGDQ